MSPFEEYMAEIEAKQAAEIARHARLRKLAEHNGDRSELIVGNDLPGLWWEVPPMLVPVVGCQMARVA